MDKINNDGKTTIDVFLGFYDNTPTTHVSNFGHYAAIERRLTRPCQKSKLCGFKKTTYPGQFIRILNTSAGKRAVIVNVHNSARVQEGSASHPGQKALSAFNESLFEHKLRNGEVVFYLGHSRYGGGPDFYPAKTRGDHVDKAFYQRQKAGVRVLTESLTGSSVDIYGSFSCDSLRYFTAPVKSAQPSITLFGTTRVPTSIENRNVFFSALTNVIYGTCDFDEDMRTNNLPGRMK